MASSTSNFRQGHEDAGGEREHDPDDEVAPGKRTLTRYLNSPTGGKPLPDSIKKSLGTRLGGLDDVRVHDDAKAAAMVRSMGAAGFTYGRNIYLADGASEDTLAHEAAHAAQHRGPAPTGPIKLGGSGGDESFADTAAAARHAPSMDLAVPTAAPAVRFQVTPPSEAEITAALVKAIGGNKTKAAQMLRDADGNSRSKIEAAVRQAFPAKDEAKDLIEKNPAGAGKPTPTVKGADEATSEGKGKGGDGKTDGAVVPPKKGAGGGASGAAKITKGDKPALDSGDPGFIGPPAPPDADLAGTPTEGLGLIQQELTEHEKWKGEIEHSREELKVGEAESLDRAAFAADAAGKGIITGTATGVATAVVGAAVTKGLEWGAVKLVGSEVPGLGAVLAGGMSAYSLATKNWKEAGAKIAGMGTGSDDYETMANTLAGIGEILDIAINVMNVIAGAIAIAAGAMWLITILTLGVATPLAAAFTAIAAGIVAVTTILDAINRGAIQPTILLFRVMHTFKSQADPRDVAEQGDGISEAASDAASFYAAKATEFGMKKMGGGEGEEVGDAKKGGGEGKGGTDKPAPTESTKAAPEEHVTHTEEPKAPPVEEHKAPPTEETKPAPEETKGKGEPEHEQTKEEKKAEKAREKQAEEQKREHEQEQARKKIEEAEQKKKDIEAESKKNKDERKENAESRDEKVQEAREKAAEQAKEKFDAEAEAKHTEIEQKLKDKLAAIDEKAKVDGEKLEDAHKARETAAKEAATAEQTAAETAADGKATAEKSAAEGRRDAAKAAAAEKVAHAQSEEPAKFKAEAEKLDAQHNAATEKLNGIENEQARSDALASENKNYAQSKADLEAQKSAAKAEAVAHAQAEQVKADAKADAKFQSETAKADLKAENAKAKAKILADKQIAAAEAHSAKETAAHEKQVASEQAEAKEHAEAENAAADKLAETKTEAAGDEAASLESEKILKERNELRKEGRKLAIERAEAEKHILETKTKLEKEGSYKKGVRDGFADATETGSNDVDLSIIKNPLEKAIFKPLGEAAGLTKGEEKKEEPKPGEPTTTAGKVGKVFTDSASVLSPSADAERIRQLREGFKEGPKKARVMLPDPPGTTEQLDAIKAKIAKDLKARAIYERAEGHNKHTQEEEKANSAKLKAAKAQNADVAGISAQHLAKVDEKGVAIGAQKEKNTEAKRTITERAQRMAGVTAVTVPLGVFTGLMGGLVAVLPNSWSGTFRGMYNDGQKLLKQFGQITLQMGNAKSSTEQTDQKLAGDNAKNLDTQKKGAKTGTTIKGTGAKITDMDTKVTGNAAVAGEETSKASAGKGAADASAKKGEADYQKLMADLTGWAQKHKAARAQGETKEAGPAHE